MPNFMFQLLLCLQTIFRNINRLFVLSFKNGNDDPTRDSFNKNYMPLGKIKDFNASVTNKPFFDQWVKKHMKNLSKCQEMMTIQQEIIFFVSLKISDISIDLSRKTNTSIPQKKKKNNFVGKLEEDDDTNMFLSLKNSKKLFETFV